MVQENEKMIAHRKIDNIYDKIVYKLNWFMIGSNSNLIKFDGTQY